MKQERRLLRCMGDIDNELILEADTLRFPRKRWGAVLVLAACLALVIAMPLWLLESGGGPLASPEEEMHGTPLPPYRVSEEGILFHQYTAEGWQATVIPQDAAQGFEELLYAGEELSGFEEMPATTPSQVLDFRNGTYVILYGLDIAVIKNYENHYDVPPVFVEDLPEEEPVWTQRCRVPGLDAAVEKAIARSSGINLGGLWPGMTQEEVTALVGEPVLIKDAEQTWFYGSYYLSFAGPDGTLTSILTDGGCQLTLDSGIGLGSTEEAVVAAYPDYIIGNSVDAVSYHISTDTADLMIETQDGIVTFITLSVGQGQLLSALSVPSITLHTASSEGWMVVTAIDKAAKGICTNLTISEPEPAQRPEGDPTDWMDLGNGVAVGLYDGDYAIVYRYAGAFDPDETGNLQPCLEGVFSGLGDAFRNALQNPTETWK